MKPGPSLTLKLSSSQINTYLEFAERHLQFKTPGLFRTDNVSNDRKATFYYSVIKPIIHGKPDLQRIRFGDFLKSSIKDEEASHYIAYYMKCIMTNNPFRTLGSFACVISWNVFFNEVLNFFNTNKDAIKKASDGFTLSTLDLSLSYLNMCGECISRNDYAAIQITHQYIYIFKKYTNEQGHDPKVTANLLVGIFIAFLEMENNLARDDLLLEYNFMRYFCAALIQCEVFNSPFDVSLYQQYSQNTSSFERLNAALLFHFQRLLPQVMPVEPVVYNFPPPVLLSQDTSSRHLNGGASEVFRSTDPARRGLVPRASTSVVERRGRSGSNATYEKMLSNVPPGRVDELANQFEHLRLIPASPSTPRTPRSARTTRKPL